MAHKNSWLVAVSILMLGIGACLCTPGGGSVGGDSDQPISDYSDPIFDIVELPVQYQDPYSGLSISFPEEWLIDTSDFGVTFATPEQAVFDNASDDILAGLSGPLFIVAAAPLAEAALEEGATADTELNAIKAAYEADYGATFLGTGGIIVDGFEGRGVQFDAANNGGVELTGRIYIVITDQLVTRFIGVSPEDQWFSFADAFDSMIASVMFPAS